MPNTPLNESLALVGRLREANKERFAGLGDQEVAQQALTELGDERYKSAAEAGGLSRAINFADTTSRSLGQPMADYLRAHGYDISAKVTENIAGMGPTLLGGAVASRLPGTAGALTGMTGLAGLSYGSTYNETADPKAALGSAAGSVAGMLGGKYVGGKARALMGPTASPVSKSIAGWAGSAIGSVPGDGIDIASQPGGLSAFTKDKINVPAYVITQAITGGVFDAMEHRREQAKLKVEAQKRDNATLDQIMAPISDAAEYQELNSKPLAARTELESARIKELHGMLNQHNEFTVQQELKRAKTMTYDDFATLPESPTSIRAQIKLLSQGKKAVIEIPKGSEIPGQVPVQWQTYLQHDTPDGFSYLYNPDLATPASIDLAKANNSMGLLLGYGVPNKPDNPIGGLVLRNRRGTEKAAVLYDATTKDQITAALQKMAEGDDYIRHEDLFSVLARRVKDKGQLRLYSIANEGSAAQGVTFGNSVIDQLEKSFVPKIKNYGPRFQADRDGNVSSKGLYKAIEQWAPSEMLSHWREAGLETLLGTDKVSKAQLGEWLQKNTPEVEVKYLEPKSNSQAEKEVARLQHDLDSKYPNWYSSDFNAIKQSEIDPVFNDLYTKYKAASDIDVRNTSDAATGRYGVEPVHVSEMENPVDILVRVPVKKVAGEDLGWPNQIKMETDTTQFKGPHFGESDKNVVASIRGYFKTLADGSRAFFPFEVQSDWAQSRKQIDSGESTDITNLVGKSPLLRSYETIAIKTAIQHALENGATKIVIPDTKTAMMIEGHDTHINTDSGGKAPQEAGMRQHYDENLQNIAKRLTRSSGERVNLGEFTTREASDYFGGKKDITGRAYDLSNLSPEVKKLFSLYDQASRADWEAQTDLALAKYNHDIAQTKAISREDFLTRAVKGENIGIDPVLKLLNGIRAQPDVKEVGLGKESKIAGYYQQGMNQLVVNRDLVMSLRQKVTTYGHEAVHGALFEVDPVIAKAHEDSVIGMGYDARKAVLDSVNAGLPKDKQINAEYLAGNKFDETTPEGRAQITHEYTAGLVEALLHAEFSKLDGQRPETGWLQYLPLPMQKVLRAWVDAVKRYFSTDSVTSILPKFDQYTAHQFEKVVDNIDKHILHSETLNLNAYLKLKKTSLFDPADYIKQLPSQDRYKQEALNNTKGGSGALFSLAKENASEDLLAKRLPKQNFFEKYIQSALFRTQTNPATTDHFNNLHFLRARLTNTELSYIAEMGQDAGRTLSREQAIESFAKQRQALIDPNNKRSQTLLGVYSKIITENQTRRDALGNPKDGTSPKQVTEADLVSTKEMKEKYHLSESETHLLSKLIDLPAKVAAQSHQNNLRLDTLRLSKLFYRLNKNQNLEQVKQKVSGINRIAGDFGAKKLEQEFVAKQVEKSKLTGDTDQLAYFTKRQGELAQQELAFRVLLGTEIKNQFGADIKLDPVKITQLTDAMAGLSTIRAHQLFITKDPGYAPMTRRGRFNVRVFGKDELSETFGRVAHNEGFDSMQEVRKFMKDKGLTEQDVEVVDKEDLKDRAKLYSSPDALRRVQQRAKEELSGLLAKVNSAYENADPEFRAELGQVLVEIDGSFKPLSDEIKDVVSIKGDKFMERRYLVPGFNENDFIPNIFEYMNFKSTVEEKALTRAEGELQVERSEFDADPEMRQRMTDELNYVLANQNEWSGLRKATFQFYLAASIRHMVQNAFQIPLNGVPQLMAAGDGMKAYGHFAKAGKYFADYARKGTTGDREIDAMLKQAEAEGAVVPSTLDFVSPHNAEVQNALDSMSASVSGKTHFGQTISFQASKFRQSVEQVMMSTSLVSESVNRKTSFITKVLSERAKGNKDLRDIYKKSVQFTDLVNFAGDKSNRPGLVMKQGKGFGNSLEGSGLHAPLLTMYALQSFTTNHISQLYAFGKNAAKGDVNAQKALATGIAHLFLATGAMGIVGARTVDEAIEEYFGTSLSTEMRKGIVKAMSHFTDEGSLWGDRIADAAMNGLPAMAGVDMSGSVGLGDLGVRYESGQPMTLEKLAGPAYGMVTKLATGAYQVATDPFNYKEAFRTAAPTSLSSIIKMFDILETGTVKNKKGQPLTDPLSGLESIAGSIGLQPTSVNKARQLESQEYRTKKELGENYQKNTGQIAKLLEEYKASGNPQVLLKANELFNNYLTSVGNMQDRDAMVDSIATEQAKLQGRITDPASLKSSQSLAELRAGYPSITPHYQSGVASLLDQLGVAQSLGQGDVLARKARSLSSSVQQRALVDQLVQAGLPPEIAHLVAQPRGVLHLGGSSE